MRDRAIPEMRMAEKMVFLAFGLAILFWMTDSAMAAFAFRKGSFTDQVFSADPHQLWMYAIVLGILVVFGGYAQIVIRQRKRAEAALRDSETKYAALVEQANDGVVIVQDGECKFANKALGDICGYSPAQVMSIPFDEVLAPESADVVARIRQTASEGNRAPVQEAAVVRPDGTKRYVEVSVSPIQFDGKPAGMGIARDVTERKQADEMLRRQAEELQRSNSELEQFAYVASHDLQEPLRMVASYVKLLERRYKEKLDEDAADFIGFAVDGANRMHHLINDLLAYSRVGTQGNPFEPCDSGEVLMQALANLRASIEESGAVIAMDAMPGLEADESQLLQVFQNLIGNAIKFRSEESPTIHVSCREDEDNFTFSVRDNGIGIDPKYADRVFTIFQQLHDKSEYPGTGIGLAICRKIVERHGGRIWLDSNESSGTTFSFTIPRARGDSW